MSQTLSVEDVKQLIHRARGVDADPIGIVTGLFEGLGDNASATGGVLKQALAASGIALPPEASDILSGVQTLEKNGDQVRLLCDSLLQPVLRGTQLRLGPTIAFTLQKFPDGLALVDITGISVNKFVWIDIRRLQFHLNAGQRSVHVDTNFGGKDFRLP